MNRSLNRKRINKSDPAKRSISERTGRKSRSTTGSKNFEDNQKKFPGKAAKRNFIRGEGSLAGKKKIIKLKNKPGKIAGLYRTPSYTTPKGITPNSEMRLNRFIAHSGICSRRDADKYITAGLVSVNGKIVTELGVKVKMSDEIRFDGKKLNAEKKVYLLLNKPKDYVTTTEDPYAKQTVMELIKNACDERIYPVGRLDKSTTGVLLFTNDGDLSDRLTHPSNNVKKIYQVSLDKPLTKNHLLQIADGVELEDGMIAADAISYIDSLSKNEIGIEIHSGRNRIVRRIFEHLGYRVRKLDRVFFAGLTKKNIPRGKWRFLSQKEVQFLMMK